MHAVNHARRTPVELIGSPQARITDRDKHKRIHNWLGEQSADFLAPFSSELVSDGSNVLESPKFSNKKPSIPYAMKCDDAEMWLLKSQSQFVADKYAAQSTNLASGGKTGDKSLKSNSLTKNQHAPLPTDLRHVLAATKIQATWRGFFARSRDPRVIEIRYELRTRRTEQYINTLCHELCILKEKQKADRKLKDLQTEAIRFMWSQIRKLQEKFENKIESKETQKHSGTNILPSHEQGTPDEAAIKKHVTWNKNEDTEELKQTVVKLQAQVLQLQDALLSFSDKLVSPNNDEVVTRCFPGDEPSSSTNQHSESDNASFDSAHIPVHETLQVSLPIQLNCSNDEEMLSARDSVPKMTVQGVLASLNSSLIEKELWSVCEQAAIALKAMKSINVKFVSPESTYLRKDGLVSFAESNLGIDTTYSAPEVNLQERPTLKSLVFSLAVTMWSTADYNMSEDQAPCLSTEIENLLIKMSHDDLEQRADVDEVIRICEEFHSSAKCNSLQVCSSLYAEACDVKRGNRKEIKSINLSELCAEGMAKTRHNFQFDVVPQINKLSFKLKPASQRKLKPRSNVDKTPHENIMLGIKNSCSLKKCPEPKLFTVQDLFSSNPELIQRLNILPGQRQKNAKAVKFALRRQTAKDPSSAPRPGMPTPPHALRTEVRLQSGDNSLNENSCTLVLRWHPSYTFDKHGNKQKSDAILGYRIYVNGQPKGMVTGAKCRALLDGLKRLSEYRIHVCAVSALGESDPSNTVIANLTPEEAVSPILSPARRSEDHSTFPIKDNEAATGADLLADPADKSAQNTSQGDDVVDRVLRRYGIKKPSNHENPVSSSFRENQARKIASSSTETSNIVKPASTSPGLPLNYVSTTSSCSSDDHITPRSKALLEQLKDKLLL